MEDKKDGDPSPYYNNNSNKSIVHQFHNNFSDNLVFLSSYWSKTMEREKGREMIRTSCEYERESCTKVVTKSLYKYHFSNNNEKSK